MTKYFVSFIRLVNIHVIKSEASLEGFINPKGTGGGPNFSIVFGNGVNKTSFVKTGPFKLAYFVEHDISYQPSKFQSFRFSGSDSTEGG